MELKPYPEYKDSGIPWLGEIPAHWSLKRIKNVFQEIDNRSSDETVELLSLTRAHGLIRQSEASDRLPSVEDLSKYKVCRPGELVMNRMQAWSGMFGVARVRGLVSPDYSVFKANSDAAIGYFELLFKTPIYVNQFAQRSQGVGAGFNRLYTPDFGAIGIAAPPQGEQQEIVKTISLFDRFFNRLLRAKLRLIEILNEQKQAIIHRAVTRGLNPDAPMKPTGLDWLPEVPEHWETRKLKHLTRFTNGLAFKPGEWKSSGVPIIRIQNLNGANDFNYTDRSDLPKHLLIQPGDLLFSWSGNRGSSFGPFIWDRMFPAYLNQHIFKVSGHSLHERFFYYALRAVTVHMEEQTHGIIGLVHITKPELGAISIPIPPPEEQSEIAWHLDGAAEYIEKTIDRARREIELIREYRTRLISDVVTGKLDVRGVELPEAEASETGVETTLDGLESIVAEGIPDTEEVTDATL